MYSGTVDSLTEAATTCVRRVRIHGTVRAAVNGATCCKKMTIRAQVMEDILNIYYKVRVTQHTS